MRNHIPGEQIIAARTSLGITRQQLAAAVGVTDGAVYNWENDRCGIQKRHYHTVRTLLRLDDEPHKPVVEQSEVNGWEVELNKTLLLDIPDYLFAHLVEAADREFRTVENQVLWFIQCCLEGSAVGGEE
jgi:transcriptional regulator with XRE-family HTH domain